MKRLGAVGVAALVAAGCASSTSNAPAGATRDGLKAAVYDYAGDFFDGNGDAAFKILTPRCQTKLGHDPFVEVIDEASSLYKGLGLTSFSIDTFAPPNATVTYGTAVEKLSKSHQPWVYSNGWRYDDC